MSYRIRCRSGSIFYQDQEGFHNFFLTEIKAQIFCTKVLFLQGNPNIGVIKNLRSIDVSVMYVGKLQI